MVQHDHQHVFLVMNAEQSCAQRDFACQIEAEARRLFDGLNDPVRRPSGRIEDLPTEIGLLGGKHHLLRYPLDR
ncbi:hypothetical protein LAUMK40_01722 [Mycobacterium kansasii]|nr:hypothetical protein LAUMK40_01722 [Mycobacterium kansasii]